MRVRVAAVVLSLACAFGAPATVRADGARVVDVPTRAGVTERILYLTPAQPKAAAILIPGGDGDIEIHPNGRVSFGGNFLVRSRDRFVQNGLAVAVLDAPSDRRSPPYLGGGFRQTPQHVDDLRAVIAWMRAETHLPVWLIGTSRGTQSAAYFATQVSQPRDGGADGIVLTSTILVGANAQDRAVPQMPLANIDVPVLVVHHRSDGCRLCPFGDIARFMALLSTPPHSQLIAVDGGTDIGDPCEAQAYHGFNGIESGVVKLIADWIAAEDARR